MARQWTEQQQAVIRHAGGDLTVSAAAGSGKTTVMVERILRIVTQERIDLSRLLVVTFTRAAAGEMRERISAALDSALAENPRDPFLRRQRQILQDAPIGTLHGFCQNTLRMYATQLGMDPEFTLCDETRRAILWDQAVQEALREAYARGDAGFELLARGWSRYTNDGLETLCEQLRSCYGASELGIAWVRKAAQDYENYAADPMHSPWAQILCARIREDVENAAEKIEKAALWMGLSGAPAKYEAAIEADRQQARRLLSLRDLETLLENLAQVTFPALGRASKKTDDMDLAERIKSARDESKKILSTLSAKWGKLFTQRDLVQDTRIMVPAMYALADLMEDCERIFSAKKESRSCLDFNDLEHFMLRLVQDDAVSRELQENYEYVFVDEYQDTNAVQEAILKRVARPGRFFCVGDAKQAIYRFRQADPTLFLERYKRSEEGETASLRRIDLSRNYRSHPGILQFVNAVCERAMDEELGGLIYDEAASLIPGRTHPEGDTCAVFVDILDAQEETEDELEALSSLERQARLAAQRIRERMGRPICEGDHYRPARYRDFVILMETMARKGSLVAQTLRQCGIPCVAQEEGDWLQQPETLLMLSALSYLDNSDRAMDLMTLMHSPLGGFSLDELLEIRRKYRQEEFPRAVRLCAQEESELGLRLSLFLAEWDELRKHARYMDVESLIWEVAGRRAWYVTLGAQNAGAEAQKRIRLLAEQARTLADSRECSLYSFLQFVRSMRISGEAGANGVGEEDAVWITTIHKSKGLEFPVVILLNAAQNFRQEGTDRLLLHDKLGLGPSAILEESRLRTTTFAREAVAVLNRTESRSERLRLLYVALTRPREELRVIASSRNPAKDLERWSREESRTDRKNARSLMDWMGPILVRHREMQDRCDAKTQSYPFALHVEISPEIWDLQEEPVQLTQAVSADAQRFLCGFAWRYPYLEAVDLPGKLSVTSLLSGFSTRRSEEPEIELPKTRKDYDPRRAGTLTHSALQYLSYRMDEQAIEKLLQDLQQRGILAEEDRRLIRRDWLMRFSHSELMRRIFVSPRVLREQMFNLKLPASQIYPEKKNCPDTVIVQGVLDLAFLEEGRWILVDYKTNRIPEGGPQVLLEHYRPQLTLYRKALEAITGIPVSQAGLALVATGDMVWMEEKDER